jgi:hypothetical protein
MIFWDEPMICQRILGGNPRGFPGFFDASSLHRKKYKNFGHIFRNFGKFSSFKCLSELQ